jgi:outer membrane protein assembly factor BamB
MGRNAILFGWLLVLICGCTQQKNSNKPAPYAPKWSVEAHPTTFAPMMFHGLLMDGTAFDVDKKTIAWYLPDIPRQRNRGVYENYFIAIDADTNDITVLDPDGKLINRVRVPVSLGSNCLKSLIHNDKLYVCVVNSILVYDLKQIIIPNLKPSFQWEAKLAPISDLPEVHTFSVDPTSGRLFIAYTPKNGLKETWVAAFGEDGKPLWKSFLAGSPAPARALGYVSASNGVVTTLVDFDNRLRGFDLDGKPLYSNDRWVPPESDGFLVGYSFLQNLGDITIITQGGGSNISAWNSKTGKQLWTQRGPDGGTFTDPVLVVNNVVYAKNGYLLAFDFTNGQLLAASDALVLSQFGGEPVFDEKRNQIYVIGQRLWAFEPIR